jgi:Uri superfamily endonuclease
MTDLSARISAHLLDDDAAARHWECDNLLDEAQSEIARLESCLRWEQNWLSRVGTHSDGCWQWGPGHYQCALRHIKECEQNSQMQEWKL